MIKIRDVWLTIHITKWWFAKSTKLCFLILILFESVKYFLYDGIHDHGSELIKIIIKDIFILFTIVVVSSIIVFFQYSKGIRIFPSSNKIEIPASDLENSVFEILIFKRFWRHLLREMISLSEISDVSNDTAYRIISDRFRLNITGSFGGRQLEFSSKQKRDECRYQILSSVRAIGSQISRDINYDVLSDN